MSRLLVVGLVLVLAAVCSAAAPVAPPPRDVSLYFPTKVGTKRVYQKWVLGEVAEEWTEVVTAVEERDRGEKVVSVGRVGDGGKVVPWERAVVTEWQLTRLEQAGEKLETPDLLIFTDPALDEWFDNHRQGIEGILRSARKRVSVPAGSFLVATPMSYLPEPSTPVSFLVIPFTQQSWYAPGVGLVRYEASSGRDEEAKPIEVVLKSYTPGKD